MSGHRSATGDGSLPELQLPVLTGVGVRHAVSLGTRRSMELVQARPSPWAVRSTARPSALYRRDQAHEKNRRPWPSGEWLREIRPRSLRKNLLADHGDHCYFSGGRARKRGGGTRDRSIDMGAPLWGHGRAIGRPGAPFKSTPERHDSAIHIRTAPRRRRPRTRIHSRRDPRHPVDDQIRIRTGAADPGRPPRRTADDVPPTGDPGPARRAGGLRRGHHRAPRER